MQLLCSPKVQSSRRTNALKRDRFFFFRQNTICFRAKIYNTSAGALRKEVVLQTRSNLLKCRKRKSIPLFVSTFFLYQYLFSIN